MCQNDFHGHHNRYMYKVDSDPNDDHNNNELMVHKGIHLLFDIDHRIVNMYHNYDYPNKYPKDNDLYDVVFVSSSQIPVHLTVEIHHNQLMFLPLNFVVISYDLMYLKYVLKIENMLVHILFAKEID
uniref:ATS domain-containing protein n=1 Tax=Schistosoma curassoni TaxID=6186 RepID=A0A183JL88_9TREM